MTQGAGEGGPSNQEEDSEIARLERELETASESARKKDRRIADLERELKAASESVRQKESRIGTLEIRLEDAQREVDGKDLQISSLNETVKGQQAGIARLREELRAVKLSVAHAQEAVDKKALENELLQSQVKAAGEGKAIFSNPMVVAMCRGLAGGWLPSLQLERVAALLQGPVLKAPAAQPATLWDIVPTEVQELHQHATPEGACFALLSGVQLGKSASVRTQLVSLLCRHLATSTEVKLGLVEMALSRAMEGLELDDEGEGGRCEQEATLFLAIGYAASLAKRFGPMVKLAAEMEPHLSRCPKPWDSLLLALENGVDLEDYARANGLVWDKDGYTGAVMNVAGVLWIRPAESRIYLMLKCNAEVNAVGADWRFPLAGREPLVLRVELHQLLPWAIGSR